MFSKFATKNSQRLSKIIKNSQRLSKILQILKDYQRLSKILKILKDYQRFSKFPKILNNDSQIIGPGTIHLQNLLMSHLIYFFRSIINILRNPNF